MKRLREKCLECGDNIPTSNRVDSKFCSPSCKARYWRKKKEQQKGLAGAGKTEPENEVKKTPHSITPLEGLRGVIENTPNQEKKDTSQKPYHPVLDCVKEEMRSVNPAYQKLAGDKIKCEAEIKREEGILLDLDKRIEKLRKEPNPKKAQPINYATNSDAYFLRELFFEEDEEKKIAFEQNRVKKIHELTQEKQLCGEYLDKNKQVLRNIERQLSKMPQYLGNPSSGSFAERWIELFEKNGKNKTTRQALVDSETKQPEEKQDEGSTEAITTENSNVKVNTNDRIISSKELMDTDYKSISFQGRWRDFLGQPAAIFHYAVHGLPGGGKSTFCLQLADYLAKNFGRVIYISGEEGYSKTLKDKVIRTKADSKNLYFNDAKSSDDIIQFIPADKFHFIFVDSLDTLRIDAAKLRELREHFPQSAFVTISQSRKDGKMKGDNEILHDSDTVIGVHKGIATTSKNRFNPSDRQFEVFPLEDKNTVKKAIGAEKYSVKK